MTPVTAPPVSTPVTPDNEPDYVQDWAEGMCDCGKVPWEMCDCGEFFLEWVCGMDSKGQCSLAGTEDCDWECPRHGGRS